MRRKVRRKVDEATREEGRKAKEGRKKT